MVYRWGYISDEVRDAAGSLPIEGVLALMEFMTAAELDPWGVAGIDPGPVNMPTVAFGPGGEGHVTILILDGPQQVWITQVQWGS